MLFFLIAPCVVAGLVPWWISGWRFAPIPAALLPVRAVGGALIASGVGILLDSFRRFALEGLGTPAPIFPTRHLIVTGWYRFVRNPMYVAVTSMVIGEALMFWNPAVLGYAVLLWLGFHLFVLAYEEPMLSSTYGSEYEAFREAVPRWIPRLSPWRQNSKEQK